ncbi:MAG: alginate export family protein [Sphingobium sp.]|nr:alginate export family protein [Sphingobium sp.]
MRRAAIVLLLALSGPALAQGRPDLTNARYDEDWSVLADKPAEGTDRFKYIPIGSDAWLTTGLELRARSEIYQNNLWGDTPHPDDGYVLLRALPYADVHAGPVRVFVQPVAGYAASMADGASPVDQTRVDLLQGFADVKLPVGDASLTLRGGRQMLPLGSERIVGTRYGPNLPLAFDGGRAIIQSGAFKLSLFALRPVKPGPGSFDDASSPTKLLWGAYATGPSLDLHYLGYRNRAASFADGSGREVRHSLGARSFGRSGPWHWNVEAVLQFGRFAGGDILAWTVGSEFGHRSRGIDAMVRFDVISGDSHAGDGRLGTFNALFPKGKYFGELSPIGPYNIINLNPHVTIDLDERLTLGLAAQAYWRYATADGIYDVPGNLLRGPGPGKFVGKQAEAVLDWAPTRTLSFTASLSAFDPAGYIRATGPAGSIAMVGLEAGYKF